MGLQPLCWAVGQSHIPRRREQQLYIDGWGCGVDKPCHLASNIGGWSTILGAIQTHWVYKPFSCYGGLAIPTEGFWPNSSFDLSSGGHNIKPIRMPSGCIFSRTITSSKNWTSFKNARNVAASGPEALGRFQEQKTPRSWRQKSPRGDGRRFANRGIEPLGRGLNSDTRRRAQNHFSEQEEAVHLAVKRLYGSVLLDQLWKILCPFRFPRRL